MATLKEKLREKLLQSGKTGVLSKLSKVPAPPEGLMKGAEKVADTLSWLPLGGGITKAVKGGVKATEIIPKVIKGSEKIRLLKTKELAKEAELMYGKSSTALSKFKRMLNTQINK